jgi:flagellar motor switch protein FliM
VSRQLSQQEIDAVFQNLQDRKGEQNPAAKAIPFDFRRPDRIAKSQLRAIHLLHDNFVRNLVSSLSAYLRSYMTVNLVSVEQLSYAEFLECLPSPTCIASLSLRPYDGSAVLELNPTLVFPILEILLGGNGRAPVNVSREITEIEQSILEGLYRIILNDLREAWRPVSAINFSIDAMEKEPQFLQILAPNEAVVAIGVEVRLGDNIGMMNIAMPSIVIKMMRQKFDQQWSVRKTQSTEEEQQRILKLVKEASVTLDVRLNGPTVTVQELLHLSEDDVLVFDYPVQRQIDLTVNGRLKYRGHIVSDGRKRSARITQHLQQTH